MFWQRSFNHLAIVFFLATILCGYANAGTDAEGTWKDDATGLTWTRKDSGSDLSWNQARDYCSSLRTGGFSDWRLPTVDELEALYDPKVSKPFKLKEPVELGGPCVLSETKNSSGDVWSFCFTYGGRSLGPATGHGSQGRTLCVRHPE